VAVRCAYSPLVVHSAQNTGPFGLASFGGRLQLFRAEVPRQKLADSLTPKPKSALSLNRRVETLRGSSGRPCRLTQNMGCQRWRPAYQLGGFRGKLRTRCSRLPRQGDPELARLSCLFSSAHTANYWHNILASGAVMGQTYCLRMSTIAINMETENPTP